LPVDAYIGGAEHAVLHLLYSRFVTMALHDWDYLPFEEPFPFLFSHGLIVKDGAKMSKSRGNVVIPDDYINKFGSDTLRMYLMFLGPYDLGGDFQDTGIAGMYRFLTRVWKLYQDNSKLQLKNSKLGKNSDRELERSLHRTIQKVTQDIGKFKFNTAIAFLMEFVNEWEDGGRLTREDCGSFLKLLAPFSPHISEELWQEIQQKEEAKAGFSSIHAAEWPGFDEQLTQLKEVEIVVQVNGKLRGKFSVSAKDAENKEKLIALAREVKGVLPYVTAKKPKAIIWVKGKLVNFVLS
jgi:leucyl-tRNA synthetase